MKPIPKPPSGTSPEAAWQRQLVDSLQAREITQIEGYNIEETTSGRKLKKQYTPLISAPPSKPYFHPFKIYQPSNIADFVGKTAPLLVDINNNGVLKTCTIIAQPAGQAESATNLAANPPVVSVADTWRFWAVRDGYMEMRENYALEIVDPPYIIPTVKNFALPLDVEYTDGVAGYYGAGAPFDDSTTATINPPLVIGVDLGTDGTNACIWIQGTPDTSDLTAPTAILRGYASADFDAVLFGSGYNQVAVGMIYIDAPGTQSNFASNFIFDHARNRYPSGNGNYPAGAGNSTLLNFRGIWQYGAGEDEGTATPSDLASQLFYPGDVILFEDPENNAGYSGTPFGIQPVVAGGTPGGGETEPIACATQAYCLFTGTSPAFLSDPYFAGPFADSNFTVLGQAPMIQSVSFGPPP